MRKIAERVINHLAEGNPLLSRQGRVYLAAPDRVVPGRVLVVDPAAIPNDVIIWLRNQQLVAYNPAPRGQGGHVFELTARGREYAAVQTNIFTET